MNGKNRGSVSSARRMPLFHGGGRGFESHTLSKNGDNSLIGKMYSLHGIDAGSNPACLPKQKR